MAQDDLEKSVQGIKDPGVRKKAYYSAQREQAESKANKGDQDAAGVASKINRKAGNADKARYYGVEKYAGKGQADVDSAFNKVGNAFSKAIPWVAGPEAKGASMARGLVPKVEEGVSSLANKARQWLGQAKPVKAALNSGTKKIEGKAAKALTGGKAAAKADSGKVYNLRDGGTTKALPKPKNAKGYDGEELKPAGKAASSPAKRGTPNEKRMNPKTGKTVGKSPMRIQSDAIERQGKKAQMESVADMNKAAAKQNPRSRAMRSDSAFGKVKSAKKGGYEPAKLKARSS